jgi:hypothetical protein
MNHPSRISYTLNHFLTFDRPHRSRNAWRVKPAEKFIRRSSHSHHYRIIEGLDQSPRSKPQYPNTVATPPDPCLRVSCEITLVFQDH